MYIDTLPTGLLMLFALREYEDVVVGPPKAGVVHSWTNILHGPTCSGGSTFFNLVTHSSERAQLADAASRFPGGYNKRHPGPVDDKSGSINL